MSCCEGPTNLKRVEVLKGVVQLGLLEAALGVKWLRQLATYTACFPRKYFQTHFFLSSSNRESLEINLRMTHSRKLSVERQALQKGRANKAADQNNSH